jgi:hypothetical protein
MSKGFSAGECFTPPWTTRAFEHSTRQARQGTHTMPALRSRDSRPMPLLPSYKWPRTSESLLAYVTNFIRKTAMGYVNSDKRWIDYL